MSESSCKKPNNCSDYDFADCEPEYQDAFMEHIKGYKPREKREPKQNQCNGQISLFDKESDCEVSRTNLFKNETYIALKE